MANSKRRIKKIEHDRQSVLEHFVEGIILLSSFIVALITAACSIVGHFDVFQTISTTMLSFLCAEYIGHSFLLKSKYFKEKEKFSFNEQFNDWTGKLYEMNGYCKSIIENSHGPHDLFIITCKKNIDNLHHILQIASQDEKIEISSDYIVNSVGVFDALNVSDEKIIELTFPIDQLHDEILKTTEDKKFFETAYKMVQERYVEKIKVLLILGNDSFIKDSRLAALCKFYDTNDGFEGKYISKIDFIKACDSNMIPSSQLDFGIYGPRMLFKVESYDPYTGSYTKNASEVQRYRKLFDEMWNFASMTHDLPNKENDKSSSANTMSLIELFECLSNEAVISENETTTELS